MARIAVPTILLHRSSKIKKRMKMRDMVIEDSKSRNRNTEILIVASMKRF
jgi:hypothetical protein